MEGFDFGVVAGFESDGKPDTCVQDFLNHADISILSEKQCLILCSQLLKCHRQISVDFFEASDFLLFMPLLDHESPYVSYSAKQCLISLYKTFVCQEKTDQSRALLNFILQQISRYIKQISYCKPVKDLALLHILDLSMALFTEKDEHDVEREELKRILKQHWMILFNYAFECQDKQFTYCSLIHSTLKLYIKLIKSDLQGKSHHDSTFVMAQYLLEKMKLKKVPEVCLRKTLAVLFQCCPDFDSLDGKTSSDKNSLCSDGIKKMFFTLVEVTHHSEITNFLGSESVCKRTSSGLNQWLCDLLARRVPCHLFIGQGNTQVLEDESKSCDLSLLRMSLLVLAKCMAFLATCENFSNNVQQKEHSVNPLEEENLWNSGLSLILTTVKKLFPHCPNSHKQLISIFSDQDDAMVQFLLFCLQGALLSRDNHHLVDSHILFLEMLLLLQWNHSLLVDWLVSPETQFIKLLLKQLKSILSNPQQWSSACHLFDKKNQEDTTIKTLELKIVKNHSKHNITNGSATEYLTKTPTQACNFNLTSYSESDDSEEENPPGSNEAASTTFKSSIEGHSTRICGEQVVRHMSEMRSASDIYSALSPSFVKSKHTLKSTSESIKKFQSAGLFPYNPRPLLRLLDQFCDVIS